MTADDDLLSAIRARVENPKARTDTPDPRARQYPPASPDLIASTEAELGFPLHPFLRRLYAEIGNGGFGPGYGLVGLVGGHRDSEGESLVRLYYAFRTGEWPEKLLPLFIWGDAIWSCIDGRRKDGTIVTHDDVDGPTVTQFTIRSWLKAWVEGVDLWSEIYEDTGREVVTVNPFTHQPMVMKAPPRAKGKRGRQS